MGTHADDLIEREELMTSTSTSSIPIDKKYCSCGAIMEEYWIVDRHCWEWLCEECERTEYIL